MVSTLNLAETRLTLASDLLFATQLKVEACNLIPLKKTHFVFQKKIAEGEYFTFNHQIVFKQLFF